MVYFRREKVNMKKRWIKIGIYFTFLVAVVGSFFVKKNRERIKNVSTTVIYANYEYDSNDLEAVVQNVDYIFVGKVISINGYEYENPIEIELKDGTTYIQYDTYTKYTVEVEECLKGDLKEGNIDKILKFGGLEKGGNSIAILENDVLPDVDEKYIFLGYKQDDGTILLSGEKSNISTDLLDCIKKYIKGANNV